MAVFKDFMVIEFCDKHVMNMKPDKCPYCLIKELREELFQTTADLETAQAQLEAEKRLHDLALEWQSSETECAEKAEAQLDAVRQIVDKANAFEFVSANEIWKILESKPG